MGFLDRFGEMIRSRLPGQQAAAPAPTAEAPPPAEEAAAPPAVEPAPAPEVLAGPAAEPVAEAAPAPEPVAAPVQAPEPVAVSQPEPVAASQPEPVAAAPAKTAQELEEERLWAETDAAWQSQNFIRVAELFEQLKALEPDQAAVIDEKIAAAQYNAGAQCEQAGDLQRALFLYQEAQRRNPNLGEAGFAIERVQNQLNPPAPAAAEPAPAPERTYTVQEGDTLSAIAERFYGSAGEYPRIFEANRDQLDNPDVIYPGQTLRIP